MGVIERSKTYATVSMFYAFSLSLRENSEQHSFDYNFQKTVDLVRIRRKICSIYYSFKYIRIFICVFIKHTKIYKEQSFLFRYVVKNLNNRFSFWMLIWRKRCYTNFDLFMNQYNSKAELLLNGEGKIESLYQMKQNAVS